MASKKPKNTRTGHHLQQREKSSGHDGDLPLHGSTDPTFVPRLGINHTVRKVPAEQVDLPTTICRAARTGVVFFVDGSLFDDKTHDAVIKELLARKSRVVLLPEVYAELAPYLAERPKAAISQALARNHRCIHHYEWPREGTWRSRTRDYYVGLLGVRKCLLEFMERDFQVVNGRLPNPGEMAKIRADAQRRFGERGFLILNKGYHAKDLKNRFTDEFLVYAALEHAIVTGEHVMLISKDEDLVEQAYKLFWLIDTHYRSMLFAEAYTRDPHAFTEVAFPRLTGNLAKTFASGANALVRKRDGFDDALLPKECNFVCFECWIVGDYVSRFAFGVERELQRVLQVKAETGGLNTSLFDQRNCHFWLFPLSLSNQLRDCAAIAVDRRILLPIGEMEVPVLDFQHAILSKERFKRFLTP